MNQPIIEIIPVGELSPDSLQNLPPSLKKRFPGREIKLASQELGHPDYAFSRTRKHYQSGPMLEKLTHFDPQAERILGVADLDLFTPGLNFIFGQAQLNGQATIIALARLHPEFWGQSPDPQLLQERTIKEAVHELGHTYGLQHCSDPRCDVLLEHAWGNRS